MGKNHAVPRLNPAVVRYACTHLAGPGESPYYIREAGGRDSLRGVMLRVHRRDVWFGVRWARGREWHKVQIARQDMTAEEVEAARVACRHVVRELEDEGGRPDLRARRMTLAELSEAYLADWETTRGERRSPRTREAYANLWRLHLLPVVLPGSSRPLGEYQMREITPDLVARLRDFLPRLAVERRPRAAQGGTIAANRALQQGEAAFNMAVARGWCAVNPFSERLVRRHPEERDPHVLAEEDYAAVGRVLRELKKACELPRPPLPYRSIAGLWLLLLTGARPSEVTDAVLSKALQRDPLDPYCLLDERYPRLRVPRAKGDRGGMKREPGRWIWLPPTAVSIIHSVPRPAGCRWILPGDLADEPIQRLNKAWTLVCREAKLKGVPLKTLRHSYRTTAAEAGVMREHVQQLLGHAGVSITDAVYLHEIAPTLAAAATKVAEHVERATGGPLA